MLLKIAVIILVLGALGGLTLTVMHVRRRRVPVPLALLHGLAVATGFTVLVVANVKDQLGGLVTVSVLLFVLAAMGGLVLFTFHLRGRPLPAMLVVLHGLAALVALSLLLAVLFIA